MEQQVLIQQTGAEVTPQQPTQAKGWRQYLFSLNDADDDGEVIFTLPGEFEEGKQTDVLSKGSTSLIVGKKKSCKSTLGTLLMWMLLKEHPNFKILHFDTEQGNKYVRRNVLRLHKLMGWGENNDNPQYMLLKLRKCDRRERLQQVEDAVKENNPDFVFIDGSADFVTSINKEEEATGIADALEKLAEESNAHICVVIHENKGNDQARGHIGTEGGNKAEVEIGVSQKDKGNCYEVSCRATRNAPFKTFAFYINPMGLPEVNGAYQAVTRSNAENNYNKALDIINELLSASESGKIPRNTLVREIVKNGVCQNTKANDFINKAVSEGKYKLDGNVRTGYICYVAPYEK